MERINLAGVLRGQGSAVFTLAGLNPSDERTRCFKRAAASFVSERSLDPELVNLGQLRGNTDVDWDTPYVDCMSDHLKSSIHQSIQYGLELCKTPTMALVAVANHDFDQILAQYSTEQANEYIRQVVCGLATGLSDSSIL